MEQMDVNYDFPVTLHLNARFQPMHRHELEDALESVLDRLGLGTVDGGGTLMEPSGEIASCDIELYLRSGEEKDLEKLVEIVERFEVPKGSALKWRAPRGGTPQDTALEEETMGTSPQSGAMADAALERPVGQQEGVALYLNGTELPAEVYESSDINLIIERLEEGLGDLGRLYSWWEGPQDTALYFYGDSFEEMTAAMERVLAEEPLCQKCRVVQIA